MNPFRIVWACAAEIYIRLSTGVAFVRGEWAMQHRIPQVRRVAGYLAALAWRIKFLRKAKARGQDVDAILSKHHEMFAGLMTSLLRGMSNATAEEIQWLNGLVQDPRHEQPVKLG